METRYWRTLETGRILCELCPRGCTLSEGQRGLCYVRMRSGNRLVLTTYGRSTGFCIDPIEKKPLNHFYPGSAILSFGTAGCNLACKFCQNWQTSQSRLTSERSESATALQIAQAAQATKCRSVAFTYNDPVVFLEYAVETAQACAQLGIKRVAVTAGYINAAPRVELFYHMDAANVDLKAFSEGFYRRLTGGHLQPVLETLRYLCRETTVWVEITTLLIPGENDSDAELHALTGWMVEQLGPGVPLHFTAFHPTWKLAKHPPTPAATLARARKIALQNGLHHVYTGNIHDPDGGSTYCSGCGKRLIRRVSWELSEWNLTPTGGCRFCQTPCVGHFEPQPGTWGAKRVPLRFSR